MQPKRDYYAKFALCKGNKRKMCGVHGRCACACACAGACAGLCVLVWQGVLLYECLKYPYAYACVRSGSRCVRVNFTSSFQRRSINNVEFAIMSKVFIKLYKIIGFYESAKWVYACVHVRVGVSACNACACCIRTQIMLMAIHVLCA